MNEFNFNGVEVNEEQFIALCESAESAINWELEEIHDRYGVSDETANAIVYLRGRSRWTIEKEQELVQRDLTGNAIPMNQVLSGDF